MRFPDSETPKGRSSPLAHLLSSVICPPSLAKSHIWGVDRAPSHMHASILGAPLYATPPNGTVLCISMGHAQARLCTHTCLSGITRDASISVKPIVVRLCHAIELCGVNVRLRHLHRSTSGSGLKNVNTNPPPLPNPYISETAFPHRSKHIPPPQRNNILAHWAKSAENPVKMPKPTKLAHSE